MPEVANPIPTINEKAVMVARRNAIMHELLKIAPLARPPQSKSTYTPPARTKVLHKKNDEPPKILPDPNPEPDVFRDDPATYTINGIHLDLYDYFFINSDKADQSQLKHLQFINDWVMQNGKTFKDGLKKLNRLDIKLGSADQGEAKVLKLYNWLRLNNGNSKTDSP